jgi:hypothetical protein
MIMRMKSPRILARLSSVLLASALMLALAFDARATIMRYLEVEDLTRASSDIFQGYVLSTSTYWNNERTKIYTEIRVQVKEAFKGGIAAGQTVTVTQLGGEKDGVMLDFAGRPEFTDGEQVVLFTTRGQRADFVVMGLKQGKMRVEGNEVVRDFSGIMLVERESAGRGLQTVQPKRTRVALDELRQRIANTR